MQPPPVLAQEVGAEFIWRCTGQSNDSSNALSWEAALDHSRRRLASSARRSILANGQMLHAAVGMINDAEPLVTTSPPVASKRSSFRQRGVAARHRAPAKKMQPPSDLVGSAKLLDLAVQLPECVHVTWWWRPATDRVHLTPAATTRATFLGVMASFPKIVARTPYFV
jgi:hypothetical protein